MEFIIRYIKNIIVNHDYIHLDHKSIDFYLSTIIYYQLEIYVSELFFDN